MIRPDIGVVYASANATRVLDDTEARALSELFDGYSPAVTSVKAALGESGASGAAACVAAVLCGRAGVVPPIAGLNEADPIARRLNLVTAQVPSRSTIRNLKPLSAASPSIIVVCRKRTWAGAGRPALIDRDQRVGGRPPLAQPLGAADQVVGHAGDDGARGGRAAPP